MSDREQVGSAAEEAAKLFAAAEAWARAHTGTLFDREHLATGAPECQVCPLCQAIQAVRNVRPETVEHLLDAAASVVAALRAATPPPPPPSGRGTPVERIDIREG